jgi:hypothetical protein
MREVAAADRDLIMWIESLEGNMPTNIHRAMIISFW